MDALFAQISSTMLSWGPPGVVALLAIIALIFERRDRKEAQAKLEEALGKWKTDTEAQGNKMQALLESLIPDGKRGSR